MSYRCGSAGGGVDLQSGAVLAAVVVAAAAADWFAAGRFSCLAACLKGLFTNFEYIKFFSCPTERNIFYKRFISIKPL